LARRRRSAAVPIPLIGQRLQPGLVIVKHKCAFGMGQRARRHPLGGMGKPRVPARAQRVQRLDQTPHHLDHACPVARDGVEGIPHQVVGVDRRGEKIGIAHFVVDRITFSKQPFQPGDHVDRSPGIVQAGRQRARGDLGQHHQRKARILVKAADSVDFEGGLERRRRRASGGVQPGQRGARDKKLARRGGKVELCSRLGGPRRESRHVDELHMAAPRGQDRLGTRGDRCGVGQRARPEAGRRAVLSQRCTGAGFDLGDGLVHAAQPRQVIDPSQDRQNHKRHHQHREQEDDDRGGTGVEPRPEQDDRDQRKDEGAEEGRQHRLRRGVLKQQAVRARCDLARRRVMGRDHHRQREGGDRQHRRGQRVQDRHHRILADPGGQRGGHDRVQHRRGQRGQDAKKRDQRHPDPQLAGQPDQVPEPFRQHRKFLATSDPEPGIWGAPVQPCVSGPARGVQVGLGERDAARGQPRGEMPGLGFERAGPGQAERIGRIGLAQRHLPRRIKRRPGGQVLRFRILCHARSAF